MFASDYLPRAQAFPRSFPLVLDLCLDFAVMFRHEGMLDSYASPTMCFFFLPGLCYSHVL